METVNPNLHPQYAYGLSLHFSQDANGAEKA